MAKKKRKSSHVQVTYNAPRFWKGIVTDSRAAGEMQMVLAWEQGNGYNDVRVLGFLLEFRRGGVKDFFTRVESKRKFEQLEAQMASVNSKPCSLEEGRGLIKEALAINRRSGTPPVRSYTINTSLMNQLVFFFPYTAYEDIEVEQESDDSHGLDAEMVVIAFVEAWCESNYEKAYDLLTSESPLREGLTREEWVERREEWMNAANPGELEPTYISEYLYQPTQVTAHKEVETTWSLEFDETPLTAMLSELPSTLVTYARTGRHWFWASYTVVQEEGEWRIQSMTDKRASALGLSLAQVEQRIQGYAQRVEEISKEQQPTDSADAQHLIQEMFIRIMQEANYNDILMHLLPSDHSVYEQAAQRMLRLNQLERCAVYLELIVERFEEQRGADLRQLAAVERMLGEKYAGIEDDERADECLNRAAEALQKSLTIEDSVEAHISLAEIFVDADHWDEAVEHLLQAKAMHPPPDDEAHIEMHLGKIAADREEFEAALVYYRRAVELAPEQVDSWVELAKIYEQLDNLEEAVVHYQHAIQQEPDNEDLYYLLSKMFTAHEQPAKAIEAIEDGLNANPDSAVLNVYLASLYLEEQDYAQTEIFLNRAELLDPELEVIATFRQVLVMQKALAAFSTQTGTGKLRQPKGKKKKRR